VAAAAVRGANRWRNSDRESGTQSVVSPVKLHASPPAPCCQPERPRPLPGHPSACAAGGCSAVLGAAPARRPRPTARQLAARRSWCRQTAAQVAVGKMPRWRTRILFAAENPSIRGGKAARPGASAPTDTLFQCAPLLTLSLVRSHPNQQALRAHPPAASRPIPLSEQSLAPWPRPPLCFPPSTADLGLRHTRLRREACLSDRQALTAPARAARGLPAATPPAQAPGKPI
jgi:hypothetical protein